jgi:hypothetical protein
MSVQVQPAKTLDLLVNRLQPRIYENVHCFDRLKTNHNAEDLDLQINNVSRLVSLSLVYLYIGYRCSAMVLRLIRKRRVQKIPIILFAVFSISKQSISAVELKLAKAKRKYT